MRFITWNVNGLRSLKYQFWQRLETFGAQLVCLQETKLTRNLVEEWMAFVPNYSSYFSFPKYKTGYSGVVTYCCETVRPIGAEDSLLEWNEIVVKNDESFDALFDKCLTESQTKSDLRKLDSEGRVIVSKHLMQMSDQLINLYVFNTYCPNACSETNDRLEFKLRFYQLLQQKAKQLMQSSDNNYVIIMGDINTSHKRIDHCEPTRDFESDPSRQWLTSLLVETESHRFIDAFRYLYPDRRESYTCWNTQSGARLTNFGTRIDYIIVDYRLKNYIKDCVIMSDTLGSDHCPVMIEFTGMRPIASTEFSRICTKLWPEFGKCTQSTLTRFWCKTNNSDKEKEMRDNLNAKNDNKLKISSIQTTLNNYFVVENNKSVQKVKSDINEPQSQALNSNNDISFIQNTNNSDVSNWATSSDTISDAQKWKNVFNAFPKPPKCSGHCEPCVLRRVNKKGSNYGKQFFVCSKPIGKPDNPLSRCNYFKWAKDLKK